jgi:hypothetical protein
MDDPRDCAVLELGAVTTIPEVIERLTRIRDEIREVAPDCGIGDFSDLYRTITQSVQRHIQERTFFVDDAYLACLDVLFANRYFEALRAWATGGTPPKAWQVLFDAPSDGTLSALRRAGMGVNAHINLDLAVATVEAGREMGDVELDHGVSPEGFVPVSRREDYLKVNRIFEEHMDELLNRLLEETDDDPVHLSFVGWLSTGAVSVARDFAWGDALDLWPLPRRSVEWTEKEAAMDDEACTYGKRLLIDLPDWIDHGL